MSPLSGSLSPQDPALPPVTQEMKRAQVIHECRALRAKDETRSCLISICAAILWPATAPVTALGRCVCASYEACNCKKPDTYYSKLFKRIDSPPENNCMLFCTVFNCNNACKCKLLGSCGGPGYDPEFGYLLPEDRARFDSLRKEEDTLYNDRKNKISNN